MPASDAHVLLEVRGNTAWLTLNRPAQRNCVTSEMMQDLYAHLLAIGPRDDVDVVALTGAGSYFCPGADLSDSRGAEAALPPRELYQLASLLVEIPQVTVAVINGACAGPGLAWASACDLRIASSAARFSTAFIHVGLVGEFGLIWTLERNLGLAKAKELTLLGDKFDADQALACGFVSRVFDEEDLRRASQEFISTLASRSPAALRAIKADFHQIGSMAMRDYVHLESVRHQANFQGDSASQIRQALAERSRSLRGT